MEAQLGDVIFPDSCGFWVGFEPKIWGTGLTGSGTVLCWPSVTVSSEQRYFPQHLSTGCFKCTPNGKMLRKPNCDSGGSTWQLANEGSEVWNGDMLLLISYGFLPIRCEQLSLLWMLFPDAYTVGRKRKVLSPLRRYAAHPQKWVRKVGIMSHGRMHPTCGSVEDTVEIWSLSKIQL